MIRYNDLFSMNMHTLKAKKKHAQRQWVTENINGAWGLSKV